MMMFIRFIASDSKPLRDHLQSPTLGQLTSMHFYGWKKGLKTGMYYLRTKPAAQAIQFTVDQSLLKEAKKQNAMAVTARAAAAAAATPAQNGSISTPASSLANSPAIPSIKQEPVSPVPLNFYLRHPLQCRRLLLLLRGPLLRAALKFWTRRKRLQRLIPNLLQPLNDNENVNWKMRNCSVRWRIRKLA